MKKNFVLLCLIALTSCSTLKVHNAASDKAGFWYALPKNIVVVEIPVKKIVYKRKECFDTISKAFPHLNLKDDYDKERDTLYSLGKPSITTRAVADSAKVYALKPSSRFLKNSNYTFIYSDLGVLNSAELQNENKLFDVVIESLNAATTVASNFLPKGERKADGTECVKVIEMLKDIQTKKYNLLTIENRAYSDVFQKQIDILNEAENNLINTFVVETKKEEFNLRFNFTPTTANLSRDLFRFNSKEGVSLIAATIRPYEEESITDDVLVKIKNPGATFAVADMVKIEINPSSPTGQLTGNAIMAANNNKLGFVFNVPVHVNATVKKGTRSIGKSSLMIAQLGTTSRLTHKIGKLSIELDPSTGALKKVSAVNTAVGSDVVKKAGEAAGNTISTFKKEKETELEGLTKERQILEEKKKIKDLKKEVE